MKIFLGLSNIASQFVDLQEGFKELGIETMSVIYGEKNNIIVNKVDYNITKLKSLFPYFKPRRISSRIKPIWDRKIEEFIIKKAFKECNVFIFFWSSFTNDFSDLKELKFLGKTVICVFVGDDVRWYYAMKQEFASYGLKPIDYPNNYDYSINGLAEKIRRLRMGEKYADFIFSRLDQAQLELRPYYRWNMMVNVKKYEENSFQRKIKPIIAHAPSSREVKGTKYILDVFEKLRKEGIEFEILLIENIPHLEALKLYKNVDILIDQLLCPGSGKLATEALACGTIVMAHMAYDKYPQKNPSECPIIDVNPDTLYEKLKNLILNYEFRVEHAKKGNPYVKTHLDVRKFCKKIIDLCEGKQVEYDYSPDFFKEKFIPESEEATLVYNKWTETVKECDWYRKNINAVERVGLKF